MTAVVHVITSLERGGAQRNTLETAARLHRPDRPQLVVTGRRAELDAEAERRLGSRLLRVPHLVGPVDPCSDVRAMGALHTLFERVRDRCGGPIVVHTHSSKAGVLGRVTASSVRGARVVHTVHGFGLEAAAPRHRWILEAAERLAGPAADALIFVSDGDQRRAASLGLVATRDVRTIRSGVDEAPFMALRGDADARRSARARFHIPDDAALAVTVGNLKPQKDPLLYVEVLAAWRRIEPTAHLLFAGDGPLRSDVERHARALGVDDALRLPGFVSDARDVLAAGDVYLLASAWEGLPRSVLEATAAGLPCVVRDTGYGDDLAWASSVACLPFDASDDAFAAALQTAHARTRAPPRLPRAFTLRGMLHDLEQLYDELLAR